MTFLQVCCRYRLSVLPHSPQTKRQPLYIIQGLKEPSYVAVSSRRILHLALPTMTLCRSTALVPRLQATEQTWKHCLARWCTMRWPARKWGVCQDLLKQERAYRVFSYVLLLPRHAMGRNEWALFTPIVQQPSVACQVKEPIAYGMYQPVWCMLHQLLAH